MDERDVIPTDEDFEAAREAIRNGAQPVDEADLPDVELALATLHQHWGSETFQLRTGLREPKNIAEQCGLRMFRGEISINEAREILRAYATRPVDEKMLKTFFRELEEQVECYSRFLQEVGDLILNPRRQPVHDEDEAIVDELANNLHPKSTLYKQEILSAFDYIQEARVAKQMGRVQLSEFTTPTAAELVVYVCDYAAKSWSSNRELAWRSRISPEYSYERRGIELFNRTAYPCLPKPQDMLTLVSEEYALARVCLRERLESGAANSAATSQISTTLLSVESWSELAIGIDEKWRFWAVSPVPPLGNRFTKADAVELVLMGDRWKEVLKAFAESDTGDVVKRSDLLIRLGYWAPMRTLDRDGRAKPGAIEAAQTADLSVRRNVALKRLKDALGDLRRELRELIEVPKGRVICLRTDSTVVRSGFVVRYLVRDKSDHLTFGPSPAR